jgi:hypothetical protein
MLADARMDEQGESHGSGRNQGWPRTTGTLAPCTLAPRHPGTLALWHSGTLALWHLGIWPLETAYTDRVIQLS